MKRRYFLFVALIGLAGLLCTQTLRAQSTILSKGDKAPVFKAKASLDGKAIQFSMKKALKKGPVVLYFYPAAYTGGCDLEAHTFAQMKDQFTKAGATIIGASADNLQRLNSFSADPDFCAGQFAIASDPKGKIAATYGLKIIPPSPGAKDVRGEEIDHGFIPRTTFVINKKGEIVKVFSSEKDGISPDEHVKKSLKIVKNM